MPVAQMFLDPVQTNNYKKHESYQLDRSRRDDRSFGEQSGRSADYDLAFECNAERA